jgi:phage FluMu protein Com
MITLKCKCGILLYKGVKEPGYSRIICPKCKVSLAVNKLPPPPKPVAIPARAPEASDAKPEPVKIDIPKMPRGQALRLI